MKCRVCGCVDEDCLCCVIHAGDPCYWVEEDLCDVCADDVVGPCPGVDVLVGFALAEMGAEL